MLTILEHKSSSYGPRTYHNALYADVTIALACDYTTAGERLTHKAAGNRYLKLDFINNKHIDLARILYKYMYENECRIVNVAGNGIYTLYKKGVTQEWCNQALYDILGKVNDFHPIHEIVSGGQTGVDIAGAVAGYKLGIDTTIALPKGFIQRYEDGKDITHTEQQIWDKIIHFSMQLSGRNF